MKVVVIDPRRTVTADIADLHLPIEPDGDVRAVHRPAALPGRAAARSTRLHQRTPPASRKPCVPRTRSTSTLSCAVTGLPAATLEKFFTPVRRDGEDGHRLLPGRQPVVVGHRQGQRHHQLPSGHRPHRQARHGAVLGHRPAQRHGRARGRRPRQHARRAHGVRERRTSRPRAALLALARHRDQAGPQGRRHVSRRRRRPHQGAVDHGDQPGRLHAGGRAGRSGDPRVPVRRRLRRDRRHRHGALRPCAPAGAAWGEKDGTVTNSERRISRQRAFCPRPARRGPTGGSSARSPAAWALATRSPMPTRPRSLPSTRRCRRSRTTARATSTSARWPRWTAPTTTPWSRCNGRALRAGPRRRACSPTAASSRPTARRASSKCPLQRRRKPHRASR